MTELWNTLLDGMGHVLAFFFAGVPSYGVAIIGLTVAVRLLLFPLTAKQARSMQRMQVVQPEIKKIQARYKDDRQKLNEEIMKFYRENKINPLAGCLPLVAQMPIFFALFTVLRFPHKHVPEATKLYQAFCGQKTVAECGAAGPDGLHFLGMDLSLAPSAATGGFVATLPYFLLIALVVLTGYLQFKQTQSRQGAQINPQMAMIGKIFPVMFAFISFSLPAGVVLYFLVSNTWQIGQQALIYGSILPATAPPAVAPDGVKPEEGKVKSSDKPDGSARPAPEQKPKPAPEQKPKPAAGEANGRPARERKPKSSSGGKGSGPTRTPDGFGRAQPAGSRPRPKRRRR